MTQFIDWIQSWTLDGKLAILLFPLIAFLLFRVSWSLVKYSEVLINNTKFGGGFIGGAIVGTVTSLPEVVTEISQALDGKPENGLGDDLGSNAFAIFLVVAGALYFWRRPFLNKMARSAVISFGMAFAAGVAMMIFVLVNRYVGVVDIPDGYMGIIPAAFFAFYVISLYVSYKSAKNEAVEHNNFTRRTSVKKAGIMIVFVTIAIISVSVTLNADMNAFQEGFNIPTDSIAGVFLAITTSLPEIVAFFMFMRSKQTSAAVATISGTLIFNYSITFFGDLAYNGPTFNNPQMGRHAPLAIVNAMMIGMVLLNTFLARKYPQQFSKRGVYLALPSAAFITYIFGWALIIAFNN